jgi:hypothetical protein
MVSPMTDLLSSLKIPNTLRSITTPESHPTPPTARRSRPLGAAMSKRVFQALVVAIATYYAALRLPASYKAITAPSPILDGAAAAHVCLLPLALRDPSLPPARARISAFGLTVSGCVVPGALPAPAPAGADGAICVRLLPEAASAARGADGFYFDTGVGGDGDAADPVRWIVKAAALAPGAGAGPVGESPALNASGSDAWDGPLWRPVGASEWQVPRLGRPRIHLLPH